MADLTGGCLCGRVRYSLTGEPTLNGLCHCRNCQRYTGSTFEAVTVYRSASVTVQGDLRPTMTLVTPAKRSTGAFARTVARESWRKPRRCRI